MTRRRNITIAIFIVVGILLITYILFNSRLIIGGPQITVFEPRDGAQLQERFIDLKGKVRSATVITVNDRPILVDKEGNFTEKLLLSPGISIIELYARDKFNREITKTLNLNYIGTEEIIVPEDIEVPEEVDESEGEEDLDSEETSEDEETEETIDSSSPDEESEEIIEE
jgi:hypothetical protein